MYRSRVPFPRVSPPKAIAALTVIITAAVLLLRVAVTGAETTAYVLTTDISAGGALGPSVVAARQMRPQDLPEGVVRDPAELDGMYARTALYAGLPVPKAALTGSSDTRVLPGGTVLQRDETLFPLGFDSRHGPALPGLLRAGDEIDLLWLGSDGAVRLVMSDLRIAVVDGGSGIVSDLGTAVQGGTGGPQLQLVVSREQAAQLVHYTTTGQLWVLFLTPESQAPEQPLIYVPARIGKAEAPR